MLKQIVSTASGATLAVAYFAVLAWVKTTPIVPFLFIAKSARLAEIFESLIAAFVACVVLGTLLGTVVRRWLGIVPALVAVGYVLASAIILGYGYDWNLARSAFGWGVLSFRLVYIAVSTAMLTLVWILLAKGEPNTAADGQPAAWLVRS